MTTSAGGSRTTAPVSADPVLGRVAGSLVRGQKASARGQATVIQAAGSVITGNVFVGRFARLRDVWLDPTPVFDEVQVEHFVGREWLLGLVDRFLDVHNRGYVVIEGDAGLGKTAFAAWLARSRDWPCHFTRRRNGRSPRPRCATSALSSSRNISWVTSSPRRGAAETAGEPGWFDQVVRAADEAGLEAASVVIVVDGLDEAERSRAISRWACQRRCRGARLSWPPAGPGPDSPHCASHGS